MILLRPIFSLIDSILDRVFSLGGAIVAAQIPAFLMEYMATLKGALMESGRNVDSMRMRATEMGRTLEEFIAKHLASPDADFVASGKIMQESLLRYETYQNAYMALDTAPIWKKFLVFLQVFDFQLVKGMHFTPALPLSVEGGVYALIGLLLGLVVYQAILKLPFHLYTYRHAKRKLAGANV